MAKRHGNADQKKADLDYEYIVVGAGIAGMYQLYKLRELGLSVRVFEAGTDVGGTWYWNRYPGARFDSESYSYGYSFSQEILDEWSWSEHFAAQPEILRYLNFVADKLDLRKDIQFQARVASAHYDETENTWKVTLEDGTVAKSRFLITAVGALSAPQMPNIPGVETFKGECFHTAKWPHGDVDFTGKRVGIIGTGATAVQTIQTIASAVGHLTVFQRTPNFCAPLNNGPIDEESMQTIRANYPKIFDQCKESFGSFLHKSDPRSTFDVSPEDREAFYQQLYDSPGFAIWLASFEDVLTDQKANDTMTEFMSRKIRERVDDPIVAEKLIPKNHGFGLRRVPMEKNYYEVYNQDNVRLVDIRETPIERIDQRGVVVADEHMELDMIILATGFNAVLGALERIDMRGVNGQSLKQKWADGPKTNLGLTTAGFPNLLTIVGPHNGATFCNIPRCIEQNVEWVTDLIEHMREHGYEKVETTRAAEESWTEHVNEVAMATLFPKADSWFMNVNQNMPDKKRTFLLYAGGNPLYREKCDAVASQAYTGFDLA